MVCSPIEIARDNGVPCVNRECELWFDEPDAQNCEGEMKSGDPAVMYCKKYMPQKT